LIWRAGTLHIKVKKGREGKAGNVRGNLFTALPEVKPIIFCRLQIEVGRQDTWPAVGYVWTFRNIPVNAQAYTDTCSCSSDEFPLRFFPTLLGSFPRAFYYLD
jgi:hypothetical protein